MVSRRRFISDVANASAALSVGGALAASPARLFATPRRSGLRVLILGGTGFLGPHFVHEAISRGHTVSIFTRGRREPGLYEEDFTHVEHLIGDRDVADGYAALRGKTWDAVIETSGYRHPWTRDAVQALAGATRRYVYISSTGVFYPYRTTDITEDGPILLADDPPQEQPSYGVMKALSENEVRAGFGDGATIVRPGYIVGPGDTTDRWTYWPVRVARGGEIMVPGLKSDPVQYIDVRDLIGWIVRLIEGGVGGTFNAVGPGRSQTMAEFVYGLGATTSVPLSWTWIEDYEWLKAYPLRTRPDGSTSGLAYAIPWVLPEGDALGHMRIDNRKALAAGLTFRPLADTARDTVAWRASDAVPQALRDQPRYVLTPEQERAMLEAWAKRARDGRDERDGGGMRPASLTSALVVFTAVSAGLAVRPAEAQRRDRRLASLKAEVAREIDARADFSADLVDQLFSFGELGFQEFESSRFLVGLLRDSSFTVEEGIAGIPTAWVATWGSGRPVISLGSDIDGIPAASQYPGVACRAPMVEGAPGHGEGHNSGLAVQVTAALAVRAILQRDEIPGTIRVWPGVAEELVGTKAYFVRAGLFAGSDVAIFTHVGDNLGVSWGLRDGTGLVSVEYAFAGQAAHAAGAPWRGRSALDAVELMNIGWNFRREHLPLAHRSHYVITDGGDQPNVVPPHASVWYYFRDLDEPGIRDLWAVGDTIASAAARMAGVELASSRVLGSAWPQHFNRPVAEAMYANIRAVGLPQWTDADQTLARAVQRLAGARDSGLAVRLDTLEPSMDPQARRGGGSDDIGDVTWTLPTVTLRFPSNIPSLPGHSWQSTIAMATPIAHKGVTAGAKVVAQTMLDLVLTPVLVDSAWSYFRNVQTKDRTYRPFIREDDTPATHLNARIMSTYREAMRPFYFDPSRFGSYLEQLGIQYPMLPREDGGCPVGR